MDNLKNVLNNIATNIKALNEIDKLRRLMFEKANKGEFFLKLDKLEEEFPIIYESGEIWSFCKKENILFTGSADSNGKNASYLFYWQ